MKRNLIASLFFACAVVLAVISCGHPNSSETSTDTKQAPSPPSEIKDPIISMVMASSIDDKGELVNPRFSFPQTEKQITAVVYLGNIKGSQLTVTWYQTSDEGDTKLFEHQIQVRSRERALSVAKNPGGLMSAGTYKVVATLDGQTKDTEFDIIPPKAPPKKTTNNRQERHFEDSDGLVQTISYDELPTEESQIRKVANSSRTKSAAPAQGQPPISGNSGSMSPPPKAFGGDGTSGCEVELLGWETAHPWDLIANVVEVYTEVECQDSHPGGGLVHLHANAGGAPLEIGTYYWEWVAHATNGAAFRVNPCEVAGGSDLPGAKLTVEAVASASDGQFISKETKSLAITLGDDTLAPRVNFVSKPEVNTKVKAGDKINLKVTAQERRIDGPWQTGVKVIQVTAKPGGLVKEPWVNPSALPKPCGEKTWEKKYEATYTVPKNPRPIIRICAITEDYVGNESSACPEFPTGDEWEGTMHSETTGNYAAGGTCTGEAWDFFVYLVVGGDGTVEGHAQASLASMPQCAGPGMAYVNYGQQAKNFGGDVSGKFDGKQFNLQFVEARLDGATLGLLNYSLLSWPFRNLVTTIVVPVRTATTAQGETSTSVAVPPSNGTVASGHHTVALRCITCK